MRITICGLVVLALVALNQVSGEEKAASTQLPLQHEEQRPFSFWMQVKLDESQKIFASLAQADFPSIVEGAEKLKTLNKIEGFVRRGNTNYIAQMQTFEFSVDEILLQAEAENVEGVTLGFQQLTLSCVNCHKQLRQPRSPEPLRPAETGAVER